MRFAIRYRWQVLYFKKKFSKLRARICIIANERTYYVDCKVLLVVIHVQKTLSSVSWFSHRFANFLPGYLLRWWWYLLVPGSTWMLTRFRSCGYLVFARMGFSKVLSKSRRKFNLYFWSTCNILLRKFYSGLFFMGTSRSLDVYRN